MAFLLNKKNWQQFLKALATKYNILAPKEGLYDLEYTFLPPEKTDEIVFPGARLTQPLKFFLYPPKENVTVDAESPEKKTIIFGVKACDLKAVSILDHIYLDPDFVDPFYKQRRDNTLLLSDDCSDPGESCFCVLMGGSPFPDKGFDLNLSFLEQGNVVIEVGSEKGKSLLEEAGAPLKDVEQSLLNEREEKRKKIVENLKKQNRSLA